MIYLIDDKKERQKELLRDSLLFQNNKDGIIAIYTRSILDEFKEMMFAQGNSNIILFHDSFFENPVNRHPQQADVIRQKLSDLADNGKTTVVFFSGGMNNRIFVHDRLCYVPVGALYRNLPHFVDKVKNGDAELRYLVFGPNYKYESLFFYRSKIWDLLFMSDLNSTVEGSDELFNNLEFLLQAMAQSGKLAELESDILDEGITVEDFKNKINIQISEYLNG